MKYMVQFRLTPGMKNQAFELFETVGPNRQPGVKFLGAWLGKQSDVAFALVDCESFDHLTSAGQFWRRFGEFEATDVLDIEQY